MTNIRKKHSADFKAKVAMFLLNLDSISAMWSSTHYDIPV